jgi:hypothetical protein
MTMLNCLARLSTAFHSADETFAELHLVMGDAPPNDAEPAFVDAIRTRALDVRGILQETVPLLEHRGDFGSTLATCQERCNDIVRRMHAELATPDNLIEVVAAGASSGSWQRWSAIVQQALDRCADSVDRIAAALLDCWREVIAGRSFRKEI